MPALDLPRRLWQRLGQARAERAAAAAFQPHPRRWVVVDVESSGLDPRRDRLLAIAAVAIVLPEGPGARPGLCPGDHFEQLLRQPDQALRRPDKANILLHGIGVGAQREGRAPEAVMQAWADWLADAPLIAYHAAFDRTLIDRLSRITLGRALPNPWLDLEHVCAVLHHDARRRSLDHWLQRFGLHCAQRHQAAADVLVTAELLLRLWPRLRARGIEDHASLRRWAGQVAQLPGRGLR